MASAVLCAVESRQLLNPIPSQERRHRHCAAACRIGRNQQQQVQLMLAFVPPSSSFSLTRIACSDKPIALGADESKDKAKELLDWSSQLDRIDDLVHTREELRAYSPPRSRFNQTNFNSRSYLPPPILSITRTRSTTLKGTYSPRRVCLASHCGPAAAMGIGLKKRTWLTPTLLLWRCR